MPVDDFLRGDDRYLGTGIIVPAHVESAEFFFFKCSVTYFIHLYVSEVL
jgi:hypothetical protein